MMRIRSLLALALACALAPGALAAHHVDAAFAAIWRETGFDRIGVQSQGMVKSLATWARDGLREISPTRLRRADDPVTMALRLVAAPGAYAHRPLIPVEGESMRDALSAAGIEIRDGAVRLGDCFVFDARTGAITGQGSALTAAQRLAAASPENSEARRSAERLLARLNALRGLVDGLRVIPDPVDPAGRWSTIVEAHRRGDSSTATIQQDLNALLGSVAAQDPSGVRALAERLIPALAALPNAAPPARLAVDHAYTTLRPYHWASIAYVVSAVLFLIALITDRRPRACSTVDADGGTPARPRPPLGRWWVAAVAVMGAGWTVHVAGAAMRGYLLQRMPLSNLYEATTTGVAFIIAVALALEVLHRTRVVGLCSALLSFIYYRWLLSSETFGNDAIEPLRAVLNSYWLDYHVTLMILAYGAFTVAFAMAVLYLAKIHLPRLMTWAPPAEELDLYNHRAIQIGWPLLGVGIVLGAVWADTAWGRMWSWDPKETWALITWLIYTAYVHMRLVRGWRGTPMAWASIAGYGCVVFTYLGVNFVLSGLHSYAGNDPVATRGLLAVLRENWFVTLPTLAAVVAAGVWAGIHRFRKRVRGAGARVRRRETSNAWG